MKDIESLILSLCHCAHAIVEWQGAVAEFIENSLEEDYASEGLCFKDVRLCVSRPPAKRVYAVKKNICVGHNVLSLWEQWVCRCREGQQDRRCVYS